MQQTRREHGRSNGLSPCEEQRREQSLENTESHEPSGNVDVNRPIDMNPPEAKGGTRFTSTNTAYGSPAVFVTGHSSTTASAAASALSIVTGVASTYCTAPRSAISASVMPSQLETS
jgi:hypothetical protein